MREYDKIYIDGAWVAPQGTGSTDVINASTEEVMGRIATGNEADVDTAVAAARRAFETWSAQPVDERLKYVQRLAEELTARTDEIAETVSGEVGMPINFAKMIQAGLPASTTASVVETAKNFEWEEQINNSLVVREPIGVVGCITPWNYPLHQTMAKVAPAIAAGCTVVHKPSEVAPLSAFLLAQIFDDIGLPPGVFNLVAGPGRVVGEAISGHPDIDMVSFTGSTTAGARVAKGGADTIKRVHLELGGKSANIILDDADLELVVPKGVFACFLNSGQTCTALTRMLVPNDKMDEVAQIAGAAVANFPLGPADSESAMLGPLASKAQQDTVRDYIRKGIEEGATLVVGGPDIPEGFDKGYFVQPTVFADVTNDMTIAQEEIFGPVLSIIGYDDEDEAVAIANDSIYGLAGGVSSADPERAKRVALRMRTGQVDVNGGSFNVVAPFGGYKQSGIGRELGKYGFEEFLEVKSLQL
ncbi:MAG: aldehyde dehydrogenase family protein [Acidimicrobiales bacterium]